MYKIFFLLTILLYSCGGSTDVKTPAKSEPGKITSQVPQQTIAGVTYDDKILFPFNLPKAKKSDDLQDIRSRYKDIINLRRDNLKTDLFDLTYNFVGPHGFANLKRRVGRKAFEGQWMKFESNFTYRYGLYDKVIGGGIYHYGDGDGFLMLLDDDEKVEPRLFSIQSNSEFFNFIGRPIMFIDDGTGVNLLLDNWSNDAFLETVQIKHKVENGMQIMMKMLDNQPVESKN